VAKDSKLKGSEHTLVKHFPSEANIQCELSNFTQMFHGVASVPVSL